MATLDDLRTRIITETARDDLVDDLAVALDSIIARSIEQYANDPWWFNQAMVSSPCVPLNDHLNLPVGFRMMVNLFAVIGGVRYTLTVRDVGTILSFYSVPQIGQPTDYALDGDAIFLWPKPNQAYPLLFEIIQDVQPPLDFAVGTSANAWTNQGQDLICAQSKLRLYRDYLSATLQDTRVIGAENQLEDAYTNLRSQSNRRMSTGRVRPSW